jgi:hypothetical protein
VSEKIAVFRGRDGANGLGALPASPRGPSLRNFESRSDGNPNGKAAARLPIVTTKGGAQQITFDFLLQSYFDSVLHEKAILPSPPGNLIIPSTLQPSDATGYALGLHPSSRTPVAVAFRSSGGKAASGVLLLKPGEIIRPVGHPDGDPSNFQGFDWGLPYGWLGGGHATLVIFPSPDADVLWPGNTEVIFHRQRMIIRDPAEDPASIIAEGLPPNWPTVFAWPGAISGAANDKQGGVNTYAVEPTRTELRLRLPTLANPETMRALFFATQAFDVDDGGAEDLAQVGFMDNTWGTFAAVGVGGPPQYPYIEFKDGPFVRLGCEGPWTGLASVAPMEGSLILVADISGGFDTLIGAEVDIVRWGKL